MFPGSFVAEDLTQASRGRFRESVALSAGATAAVFHAFDVTLGSRVAVKVSHGTLEANHCLREEHRVLTGPLSNIAEKGKEPTACRCFGLLEFEGRVAIVLEYLDPELFEPIDAIADRLEYQHGQNAEGDAKARFPSGSEAAPLTEYQILEILTPFFGLLAAAHEIGVIYNDVGFEKAGHLLWSAQDRQLKVIDWANVIDTTRASSTQTRRPYHDVIGCGELLLLLRRGPDAPYPPSEEEMRAFGEFGVLAARCLDFADPRSYATATPLEQAARQRMREVEHEFKAGFDQLRALFDVGDPNTDFEAAKNGVARVRRLIPAAPELGELDSSLRSWTASLTAKNVLEQAEAELREGQPAAAYQKFRLVLNLVRANERGAPTGNGEAETRSPSQRLGPGRGIVLTRDEKALRLEMVLCAALDEFPRLVPPGSADAILGASAEDLPDIAGALLREMLDSDAFVGRRDADPWFGIELLAALGECAGVTLWSAEFHRLSEENGAAEGGDLAAAERLQALCGLRQGLSRLELKRPSDDTWRDFVGSYEGILNEVRALGGRLTPSEFGSARGLDRLDEPIIKALGLAQRAREDWANAAFTRAIESLELLREVDWESRAARTWTAHAQVVEARWAFPGDQLTVPTALAFLLTEESPAAVAFLLRDSVTELEAWADDAPGARGGQAARPPSYMEALRVLIEAFLRAFEYLGIPRQRHPAQKLALRALLHCVGEFDSVEAVRAMGAQLLGSNWDNAAWEFANEAVQISQAIDERSRQQPMLKKIVGMGQRTSSESVSSQLLDTVQRLNVAAPNAPLLGALVRLPEIRFHAALAYCELGDWDAAKAVLGELRIVGTRTDEIFVRATSLHRAVALAQGAAADSRQGDGSSAQVKLDQALHELDANARFRPEFRGVVQALKERKAQLARPEAATHPATRQA